MMGFSNLGGACCEGAGKGGVREVLQAGLPTIAPALPGGPGGSVAQAFAMESMFEDDISILTQEALGPSEVWLDAPEDPSLGGDMCSASHFALITAYGDIKERLGGLERENATLRRRLKVYEIKYPLISDFGEEHGFSLYEIKDGSLLEVEKVSLQQQLNQFQHELQKNKEQEEQLGEMIQAYEKLCVEKNDLETELGEMRALVETHLRQICGLEQQLRQQQGLRDAAFPSLSPPPAPAPPCAELDLHYLAMRGGSGLSHAGWPGPSPSMSDLERRRLEEALEAAQGEARGAQLREEQLQAECERLQGELKQMQETRAQDLASNQSERDMAWVKRVGDDQVNLALAYTELTEELGRLRELSALQGRILRTLLQEQALSGGERELGRHGMIENLDFSSFRPHWEPAEEREQAELGNRSRVAGASGALQVLISPGLQDGKAGTVLELQFEGLQEHNGASSLGQVAEVAWMEGPLQQAEFCTNTEHSASTCSVGLAGLPSSGPPPLSALRMPVPDRR
ncbi:PREDICTED: TANK-binding kinase 1-binding protein 1 [Condylura cristata]|uniref:TANK-binding kinase 1-binding protein 1 n=1 Tax=Condylura cristata TaxID=143302 RepID=UPI000642B3D3|nr:PREDICTED: TANK-binding kinase 1-binding protein 1 [Condylura cristata]